MVNYALKSAVVRTGKQDFLDAATGLAEACEGLASMNAELHELDKVIDSVQLAQDIVKNFDGDAEQIIKLVNCHHAMERLLGVAESKITVSAAQEGLGEALKNMWKKIKEWFARLGDWFRKLFYSLEGELKHLEGMVDAKNDDKFNPDAKFDDPMPTKQVLDLAFDVAAATRPTVVKLLEIGEKMKIPSPEEVGKAIKEGEADLDAKIFKLIGIDPAEFKELGKGQQAIKAKVQQICKDSELAQNPPSNPIEAFSKVLKSGTAAELGFKTAADVRAIVLKLTKDVRDGNALMPKLQAFIKKVSDACDKYQQMAETMGAGDILKCYRSVLNLANSLMNKYYSKFIRWELMLVTRVVRKMYTK